MKKKKEIPRLTKQEKLNLLEFLKGDESSYLTGMTMCKKYLEIYPNEKNFSRKVKKLKKTNKVKRIESYRYTTLNFSKGLMLETPSLISTFKYEI